MPDRILILGGTKEAAALAASLVSHGHDVTTSLAGRTKEPKPLEGEVRVGGFGGVDGLARYLTANQITRLIDATHPFANQISANAQEAAHKAGVGLEIRTRLPWARTSSDNWQEVASLTEAAEALLQGDRVLLALGSQHLQPFQRRDDVFFLVRMIDDPKTPLELANHELLLGKPAQTASAEVKILRDYNINKIVCRNSGGTGAYAKIEAAQALCLPVVMLQMPVAKTTKL